MFSPSGSAILQTMSSSGPPTPMQMSYHAPSLVPEVFSTPEDQRSEVVGSDSRYPTSLATSAILDAPLSQERMKKSRQNETEEKKQMRREADARNKALKRAAKKKEMQLPTLN